MLGFFNIGTNEFVLVAFVLLFWGGVAVLLREIFLFLRKNRD
jgi:hypothetical protein